MNSADFIEHDDPLHHEAADYDRWFMEQVNIAIREADDPHAVPVSDEEAKAQWAAQRSDLLKRIQGEKPPQNHAKRLPVAGESHGAEGNDSGKSTAESTPCQRRFLAYGGPRRPAFDLEMRQRRFPGSTNGWTPGRLPCSFPHRETARPSGFAGARKSRSRSHCFHDFRHGPRSVSDTPPKARMGMKCPVCGVADLIHDTRDLPYSYKGQTTIIPMVTGDFCPACEESILDAAESDRVMREMRIFSDQFDFD